MGGVRGLRHCKIDACSQAPNLRGFVDRGLLFVPVQQLNGFALGRHQISHIWKWQLGRFGLGWRRSGPQKGCNISHTDTQLARLRCCRLQCRRCTPKCTWLKEIVSLAHCGVQPHLLECHCELAFRRRTIWLDSANQANGDVFHQRLRTEGRREAPSTFGTLADGKASRLELLGQRGSLF